MRAAIKALVLELFDEGYAAKIKLHSWAPPEQPQKKSRRDNKTCPTLDNTLYFQGRFTVPKADLEKIALMMGYHIRPYSRAGIFVGTDQDLSRVYHDTKPFITSEDFDDEDLQDPDDHGREL